MQVASDSFPQAIPVRPEPPPRTHERQETVRPVPESEKGDAPARQQVRPHDSPPEPAKSPQGAQPEPQPAPEPGTNQGNATLPIGANLDVFA